MASTQCTTPSDKDNGSKSAITSTQYVAPSEKDCIAKSAMARAQYVDTKPREIDTIGSFHEN